MKLDSEIEREEANTYEPYDPYDLDLRAAVTYSFQALITDRLVASRWCMRIHRIFSEVDKLGCFVI